MADNKDAGTQAQDREVIAPFAPAAETSGTAPQQAPQFLVTGIMPAGPVLPTPGIDTTIPGGKYKVGDEWQNANGEGIDEKGKVTRPIDFRGTGF